MGLTTPTAAQQPVFRSGIDLVTVDVTVLDRSGKPVPQLTPESFTIRVDGAPRRVVSAEFIAHRPQPLGGAYGTEHFSSNEHVETGRLVMMVVDQMHIRRVEGLATLRAAATFIDTLDRQDRVAAAPLDHGGTIEFTTDHVTVKRYLQRLTGSAVAMPTHFKLGLSEALAIADGSRTRLDLAVRRECGAPIARIESTARMAAADGLRDPCPIQVEQESRALAQMARAEGRIAVESLGRLIARLGEIEGPKTVVLISEGLVAEPQLLDLTALGDAAQAARVTLYVLQLETPILDASSNDVSPTLIPDMQLRSDGLARLAGSARGSLFRVVGPDPYPFRRILQEMSGYYLVAFEAQEGDRDGKTHRIDVSTHASAATVRARPSFRVAPAATAAIAESELVRLLRTPRLATELPLRAAAYMFREPQGPRMKMVVSAETETMAREVTVGFVVVDSAGVIAASGAGTSEGGRYNAPVVVAPGRYTVRVAAIDDASGRRGSVERKVDAVLGGKAGLLQVSDLMIAEPPVAAGAPVVPTVVRAGRERAVVYFEAYQLPAAPAPATHVEIRVQRDGDTSAPATLRAVPANAAAGRWTFTAELPVRDLPPGSYVATTTMAVPNAEPLTLSRRFVIAR
jgi:VWFA-related protein